MSNEIRFFQLNTGAKIPSVGLGTWQSNPGVVGQAIEIAVKAGYRHIDGSPIYGNEKEIGSALKKLFDDGVVKREDLWITSKLWNTEHAPEDVPLALNRTLRDLQLDYVDLYLIHWPVAMKKESSLDKESVGFNSENILEPNIFSTTEKKGSSDSNPKNLVQPNLASTWKEMESLYDSGKARAIGVSNFSVKKLGDLLEGARVPPAVNQVEAHPSWRQDKLKDFCNSKGVHFSGYSPLGSPTWLKSSVLNHPVLTSIAEKLGKTPAQVALRWGLQAGHSVLPKSENETRIKENLNIFDWSIPEDLFAKFSEIEQERLLRMDVFVDENHGGYKTVEELWDGEI